MPDPSKLQKAVARLNLSDVVVKNITATLAANVVPGVTLALGDPTSFQLAGPSCLNLLTYLGDDPEAGSRLLVFEVKAGVRILKGTSADIQGLTGEGLEAAVLGTIEAFFYVSYTEEAEEGSFVDEDCLAQFAANNVPFNAWPYWRELVQSACSRMSLPRVVLPAKRLGPARPVKFGPTEAIQTTIPLQRIAEAT